MSTDDETMELREVLEHIMRVTGKNRRQAEAALLEKIRSGELPATGISMETGKREPLPPGDYQIKRGSK